MKLRILFFLTVLACNVSFGQIGIPGATPVTENFDGIGTGTTASLPGNWKMSPAGDAAPTWVNAGNFTAVSQGASSGSPATGGRYNWGNGATTTDRAIGYMTSGGYASPNSVMAYYQNTSGVQINDLAISFDYERYRVNSAACSITFFTSTDGATWTAQTAGDSGAFATGISSYNFTAGTVVSKSFTLTGVNIANGGNFYLRWNFNTTGANSQGVGLDNVSLTATLAPLGITTANNGDWYTPGTWTGGVVPTNGQSVIINHAVTSTTAVTRDAGTTTTVNVGASLAMTGVTYTNNGTTTINGTFRLNIGGWATGNNFVYSGTTNLLTISSTSNYAINNTDVFWPAANGPYNVSVSQAAGITVNSGMVRTIAGDLTDSGAITMAIGALTINGNCIISANGFFSAEPIYGAASTLLYQSLGTYGRGFEWNALGVGTIGVTPGYPNNVTIGAVTTLNYNNGTPLAKAMAGNLDLSSAGSFDMSFGGGASGGALTVAGNVSIGAGSTLTLGNTFGDDLKIGGNFTNVGGSFNGNGRAVYFTKNGTQTVTCSLAALTIPYVVFQPASGSTTVILGALTNLTVSAPAGGNAISFNSAADVFSIASNTLTIGTAATANVVSGSGTFSGTTSSKLTLLGTGSVGTLNFTTGSQNLGTLTVNRTSAAIACTMGTPLAVLTTVTLTNGIVDLGNNYMTLSTAGTITGGSANNFIIADSGYGSNAGLRKIFTSPASFTYPVGDRAASADGMQYSPMTLSFTGGSYSSAYAAVAINDIKEPNFDAASEYITRYWDVSTSGITSPTTFTANGTYLDADVNAPAQEANYIGNKWNGTIWSNGGSPVNTATNVTNTVPCTAGATNHVTAGRRDSDINVQASAVTYLTGSTYDFGSVLVGGTNPVTFTIQNIGQQNLTVSLPSTSPSAPYVYTTPYTAGTIAGPAGTKTFVVTFTPTGPGTFTGSIVIPSTDPDEPSYTINFTGIGVTPAPEIDVRGNGIVIPPGNTPSGLDFTLFGAQTIATTSAAKTYTINNTGTATLTLTGSFVTLGGANPGDFAIASMPATSIATSSNTAFTVTFTPTAFGTRNATITVYSNDSDEATYTYNIQGTGACGTATNTITPTSGPVGTEVTITAAANNLTGATATFNGVSATIIPIDATHIKAIVPSGTTTGNLITTNSQGCTASNIFTVIDNAITSCQGGAALTELFISEVTDSNNGGLSYVEIYNPTASSVNLSSGSYSVQVANNGGAYSFTLGLTGTINAGSTYTVALGSDSSCPATPGGTGSYAAQISGGGGINFTAGGHDHIGLFKGAALVDSWGIFGNANWAPASIGTNGATFRRKKTATPLPNTTYSNADWNIIDYPGTACADNDYSDIGVYDFSTGTPPTVTQNPSFTPSCRATSLTVAGTEGFVGGNALAYQWYVVAPNTAAWTALTNAGVYSGTTSATLNISNMTGLDGYQFYCQIRENGATCYSASNAVKISEAGTVTWNGSAWSPSPPTATSVVIINGNYNTATNGSFDACSVTVNGGFTLTIGASNYVSIQNDLTVSASANLLVQNNGSLVMIDDAGVVINSGTTQIQKTTSPYNKFDYTYWSAPVLNPAIGTTFTGWRTDYAFQFVTANYADIVAPINGFDDDGNAWVYTPPATTMTKGKGYAIMAPTTGSFPTTSTVIFSGPVNNGVVNILLSASANAASAIDDFNLIGNPYPSAIYANDFINANTNISGTLYFWTHRTGISSSNPGPDANNFITADYAMYNLSGGISSGTGSPVPTGYIASGEGFFVEANSYTNILFNNSMRNKTYNNTQFYRPANHSHLEDTAVEKDRLWLNFESADGLFSQQLIAYFDNTTLGFDRGYDGLVSQTSNTLSFYSFIGDDKYRIQARPSFESNDQVPLGYSSTMAGTYSIGIGAKEGQLNYPNTNIYLEDKLLGIVHDLKQAPYTFTTPAGVFNDRFLLKYTNSSLGTIDVEALQNSVAVAVSGSDINVKSYTEMISDITVYDILGRQVFAKQNVGSAEFTISSAVMNQQALIVKVKLENGVIINRKIIF